MVCLGDPKKNKKKYESPRKVWDLARIVEEQKLLEEYGLKNMRELWITKQELKKIRRQARRLLSLGERGEKEAKQLLASVARLGLGNEATTIDNLLSLKVQDILDRRLESQVFKKGLAKSIMQSRQIITHGFIAINGKRVCAPSYIVPAAEEKLISYYKPIDLNQEPVPSHRRSGEPAVEAKEAEAVKEKIEEKAEEKTGQKNA